MTKTEIIAESRRRSRIGTSGASDATVILLIDDAFRQFSRDVHGIESRDYLNLTGYFTPRTVQAFHLAIVGSTENDIDSDIQIGTSTESFVSGTDMATNLQTAIRAAIGGSADLTVTWTNFYFTVDGIDSTSIAITAPTSTTDYFNAVSQLFGGNQSGTDSLTCDFPEGCTVNVDLPGEAVSVHRVMFDDVELIPYNDAELYLDPQATGDPINYRIYERKMQVYPIPTALKKFFIEYKKIIDVSDDAVGDELSSIPDEFQTKGICNYVAYLLLDGAFEENRAALRYQQYEDAVTKYQIWVLNQNTDIPKQPTERLNYQVVVE